MARKAKALLPGVVSNNTTWPACPNGCDLHGVAIVTSSGVREEVAFGSLEHEVTRAMVADTDIAICIDLKAFGMALIL
ncbi:MAG: hypothetical protein KIT10_12285 [Flavobacteriales bacterium]|nr:hypothetical protein [Flavobacteriales bacterium]